MTLNSPSNKIHKISRNRNRKKSTMNFPKRDLDHIAAALGHYFPLNLAPPMIPVSSQSSNSDISPPLPTQINPRPSAHFHSPLTTSTQAICHVVNVPSSSDCPMPQRRPPRHPARPPQPPQPRLPTTRPRLPFPWYTHRANSSVSPL